MYPVAFARWLGNVVILAVPRDDVFNELWVACLGRTESTDADDKCSLARSSPGHHIPVGSSFSHPLNTVEYWHEFADAVRIPELLRHVLPSLSPPSKRRTHVPEAVLCVFSRR